MNKKQYTTLNMSIYHSHQDYIKDGGKVGIKDFSINHIENGGVKEWLELNRGVNLSLANMNNVVRTLAMQDDKFTGAKAVASLLSCVRHYDMDLPVAEAILTDEYWDSRLKNTNKRQSLDSDLGM